MCTFNVDGSIGSIIVPAPIETQPAAPSWAILAPSATSKFKGWKNIRYLFIFGASYSSTCIPSSMGKLEPTDEEPLGVPFPGITTCEPGAPNWVGHLITEYTPNPILVFNYAISGSTVPEVTLQIERYFLSDESGPSKRGVKWTAENSLFITWVGLNDLAISPYPEEPIIELFNGQKKLYAAGARNFLIINVPPIDRAPACTMMEMYGVDEEDREASVQRAAARFLNWNTALAASARFFASPKPAPLTPDYNPELIMDPAVRPPVAIAEDQINEGVSMLLFSSYESMSAILDDPVGHGFSEVDLKKMNGSIWVDHMHPTSRVHDLLARDLSRFLSKI